MPPLGQTHIVAPAYTSFEVVAQGDGYWRLLVFAGDSAGHRAQRDKDVYDDLTIQELADVVDATLVGYDGSLPPLAAP